MPYCLRRPVRGPPVDAGRRQPAAPTPAWTGTRSATSPGSRCLQFGSGTGHPRVREGCLYLKTSTPHSRHRPRHVGPSPARSSRVAGVGATPSGPGRASRRPWRPPCPTVRRCGVP
ncbi:carboxylesterase family protein [Streptomyces eurythermus]